MHSETRKSLTAPYNANFPHRAVTVWMYLKDRADNTTGECFPAIKTIARDIKVSVRTVQRGINDLVSAGLLCKVYRQREHNRGQTSNLYTLL